MEKIIKPEAQANLTDVISDDLADMVLILAADTSDVLYGGAKEALIAQHELEKIDQDVAAAVAALDAIETGGSVDQLEAVAEPASDYHAVADVSADIETQEPLEADYRPTALVQEYFGSILGYDEFQVFVNPEQLLKHDNVNERYFDRITQYDALSPGVESGGAASDFAPKAASFDHARPHLNVVNHSSAAADVAVSKPPVVPPVVDPKPPVVDPKPPVVEPEPPVVVDPKPPVVNPGPPVVNPGPPVVADPKPPVKVQVLISDMSEEDMGSTSVSSFINKKPLGDLYLILGNDNPVAGKSALSKLVSKGATVLDLVNAHPGVADLDMNLSDGEKNLVSDLTKTEQQAIKISDVLSDGISDTILYQVLGNGNAKTGADLAKTYSSKGHSLYDVVQAHSDMLHFNTDLL